MATQGIVYILTNPAIPNHVKIGKTGIDNLESRIRSLFTTGVPVPFECYRASLVNDPDRVERLIHAVFADNRANPRREFFRISIERAEAALMLAEIKDLTPGRDILSADPAEAAEQQVALDAARAAIADREHIDTIIVPARDVAPDGTAGFEDVFLRENRWYEFRISKPYRDRVKWIAGYRIKPVQAVTHVAPIARFEPSPITDGYWMAIFGEPPRELDRAIPHGDAASLMQGSRYTNKVNLLTANSLAELFAEV